MTTTTAYGCLAAMLTGFAGSAIAQENKPVEEVPVWGTRVWASSLNLDEETFELKQSDHISDLLRTIPGVDVGGAHSMNQRITIRSMDDKDLRITIDGANQNTYMYHHMGNLQIHADILSSAEIGIGNNSVIDGGLGGTVRFKTKSADELLGGDQQFGGRVQAGYATNAYSSFALSGYGQLTDTVDVLAYFNGVQKGDYEVGGGKILNANGDELPGTDGKVRGFEGDVTDGLLKLGWNPSENQRLRIGYEAYTDKGDYSYRPDMGLATDLAINEGVGGPLLWPTEFTRDTLTLNYDLQWGGNSTLEAAVFSNTSTLERDENGWATAPGWEDYAGIIKGEATNSGINLLATTDPGSTGLGDHELTYGLESIHYETEFTANYNAIPGERSAEDATNTAVYLQDRISLGSAFAIVPGVRYSRYDIDSTVVKDTFSKVTGALALEYYVTDDLLLHASSTQLFKGPEIGEVFTGAGLYDAANPDIQAEEGTNNEISIAWRNSRYNAGVTVFQTDIDNYIYDYAPNPGGRYWKDNIGDMTLEGFEAYAGLTLGNLVSTLTYSTAESELSANADYPALEGARLDRTQGDTISLNLDYDITAFNLTLHWDVLLVDDVAAGLDLDGATLDNAKDGYTVHNISALWTPAGVEGLSVTLGVDNLLDEYYASQSSRTGVSFHPRFGQLYLQDFEPGRNVKATVAYTF